ncbi:MAG: DUF4936 family protein [Thiobacillaceae bacterium]|jgi:hypothetical protein|nr:DUF4936 family protein [Thiobacillaceae bacterium]
MALSHLYCVWYRVADDGSDTETVVRGMMARLACRTGVAGRLLKKRDEPRLWMEVYDGVADPAAFEARLRQAVDEFDVDMFVADDRRVECFLGEAPVAAACAPRT